MRHHLLALGLATLGTVVGCSLAGDDVGTSLEALTDRELAERALRILGGKVDGAEQQCQRCHDVNRATVRKWADDYRATRAVLGDEARSVDARIDFMRRDPNDRASSFAPSKLGFLTAGTHFAPSAVSAARQPTTFAHASMLDRLFASRPELGVRFRADTRMPIEADYDRLSASDYETVMTWVDKGLPELDRLLPEQPRPTTCTDDFEGLAAYAHEVRTNNWQTVNRDAPLTMFACDPGQATLDCFSQTAGGKAVFPRAADRPFGRGWEREGSTIRVLRELDYKTFFWTRTSADGRFVANGMSSGADGAVIADLAAAFATTGPRTRDILAAARYDPDFWPDNKGFMFQGTGRGGVFCPQSLLTNPRTTRLSFTESECSKLDAVGLYQTVGQRIGDNAIADRFVVNGKFASDNPGQTAGDHDLGATFGPDAKAIVRVMFARGNDASTGYEVKQSVELATPFEGDIMMSRSANLLGARVAGESGPLGYAIRRLTSSPGPDGYRFSLKPIGRVCMPGNKANFSFDERFLATHHYLTRADFPSDAAFAEYGRKGASEILVADFVTKQKVSIARMQPGQFALFPHFRSDGWLYFLVRDANAKREYIVASDWALRQRPTP